MDTPIYDAIMAEQGFDPASVTPISTRDDRLTVHATWLGKVERAMKTGYRTPRARKLTAVKAIES